jgi:hypothetical protein
MSASKEFRECQKLTLEIMGILSKIIGYITVMCELKYNWENADADYEIIENYHSKMLDLLNKILQIVLASQGWKPDGMPLDWIMSEPDYNYDKNIECVPYNVSEKSFLNGAIIITARTDYKYYPNMSNVRVYTEKTFEPYKFTMTTDDTIFDEILMCNFHIQITDSGVHSISPRYLIRSVEDILKVLNDELVDC